jgi:hypothetical protein
MIEVLNHAKKIEETENPLVQSGKVPKHRDRSRESVPTVPPPVALSSIPKQVMPNDELVTLPLDHRAGFLLAHMDGATSLRTIIDISGMPQNELTNLIEVLLAFNVIRLA